MSNKQITNTVLMIEPVSFGYNYQTAKNNFFQQNDSVSVESIQEKAKEEFRNMVEKLRKFGINVLVVKDTDQPHTPDSIFPNNWISFHSDGKVVLYPMYAENRRVERREDILDSIEKEGFIINEIIDYSRAEEEDIFLEGTGSMVLDRTNEIAYAAISERTNEELFIEFCEDLEFSPVVFHSTQEKNGKRYPVYHTNVMMSVAEDFAIICKESIQDVKERKLVIDFLQTTKKEVIIISEEQMNHFLGNTLQLENDKKERFLVMSNTAYQSLNAGQINAINKYSQILVFDIPTIEKYGGGGVRCMLAEIFLPKAES
ncbi:MULTISPECIES: citrulline utilization hydrolase CtlX [unclassified Apibacter]|uniref:citrulline utilization hydrolase CtlX n=1 Tax=unclassified Apibacter TaxID=2630820 RepID=UPI001C698407|nr:MULTISPECIES: arginine deiminase-related protein [unclassified Apibacter]MCX8677788.1 amidinotransferase [Apibacter sp. B3919]